MEIRKKENENIQKVERRSQENRNEENCEKKS